VRCSQSVPVAWCLVVLGAYWKMDDGQNISQEKAGIFLTHAIHPSINPCSLHASIAFRLALTHPCPRFLFPTLFSLFWAWQLGSLADSVWCSLNGKPLAVRCFRARSLSLARQCPSSSLPRFTPAGPPYRIPDSLTHCHHHNISIDSVTLFVCRLPYPGLRCPARPNMADPPRVAD
jgi:hypothetical protein